MTPQTDLSTWPSKFETARLLGIGERTLDRQIKRTGCPEIRMRPRDSGRKPEPVCNPEDVQRIISERNRAVPMPAETSMAVALPLRPAEVPALARVFEAFGAIASRAPEPSPLWLTLKQASVYSGLSMAILQRLASTRRVVAVKDNGWKIKRAALDGLDL